MNYSIDEKEESPQRGPKLSEYEDIDEIKPSVMTAIEIPVNEAESNHTMPDIIISSPELSPSPKEIVVDEVKNSN